MSDIQILNSLQDKLDESILSKKYNVEDAKQYLKLVKELEIRDSERTLTVGYWVLQSQPSTLSLNDLWQIKEQVAFASLDCNAIPIGRQLLNQIQQRFPSSARAQQLTVMYQEARNPYDQGQMQGIVQNIQEIEEMGKDEQKDVFRKRKISLNKTSGNIPQAVALLREHIKINWTDKVAWEELSNLYLQLYMYKFAAFCYEELILLEPHNLLYYIRYGEILYTNAGSNSAEDYGNALAYFSKAVQLTEGSNGRSLYGLINSLLQVTVIQKNTSEQHLFLMAAAGQKLEELYQDHSPIMLKAVQKFIEDSTAFMKSNQKKGKVTQQGKKK